MNSSKRGFDLARTIALALPDVEEGTSWGAAAFKLRGKMIACQPTNKAAEPDSLVVMLDFPQRDELLAAEPDVYYLKEHYEGYPCLLVRLKRVHPDALRDLLGMAWRYIDAKTKRKPRARAPKRHAAVRASLVMACLLGAALNGEARQSADAIARAVVIGQAYASGNVYVAGFDEDETRAWPNRLSVVPLRSTARQPRFAGFVRIVAQDSEEHYYFPQREERDPGTPDIFSTMDKMALQDRNLARYRSDIEDHTPMSILGWDDRLDLTNISFRDQGLLRPVTPRERAEIAEAKKTAVRKDGECTTEPQFLDAAKVILTAALVKAGLTIRLSEYATPGCAGHLSEIFVLDVLIPGQEPRRFEFHHYQGLL